MIACHCQRYNIALDTWEKIADMDYPTLYPGVTTFGNTIYSIAGRAIMEAQCYTCNLVQMYEIEANTWRTCTTEYKLSVINLGVVTLPNNTILCYGGKTKSGNNVPHSYIFNGSMFIETCELYEEKKVGKISTYFIDPGVVWENKVYTFSQTGDLFSYDINSRKWIVIKLRSQNRI